MTNVLQQHTYEILTGLTFIVGILGAIQVTVNSRAGSHLGFPILGTVLSFGGGWIILLIGIYIEAYSFKFPTCTKKPSQLEHENLVIPPSVHISLSSKIVPLKKDDSDTQSVEINSIPNASVSLPADTSVSITPDVGTGTPILSSSSLSSSSSSQPTPLPLLRCTPSLRYYHYFPGIFGIMFVTASIVLSSYIGYALFWISAIVGQLASSAGLDHIGFMMPRKRITVPKLCALFLAMIGAGMSVADRFITTTNNNTSSTPPTKDPNNNTVVGIDFTILCVFIAFLVGSFMPLQATFNRSASLSLPSKLQATFVSFTVGTLAALVILIIQLGIDIPKTEKLGNLFKETQIFMYMGGPLGVVYIASTIWFITILGNSTYFIALVGGQITGSSILDTIGFLNSPVRSTGIIRGFGICFVILASILMQEELWRKGFDSLRSRFGSKNSRENTENRIIMQ